MVWRPFIMGVLTVAFFVSVLWPSLGPSWSDNHLFVSPDERAAFLFAEQIAQGQPVGFVEPRNGELGGLLHPRSAVAVGELILPGSFVGFMLMAGLWGKIFGASAMLLVTPLLAVLAAFAWRASLLKIFSDRLLADLAWGLMLIHPALWYYTGRPMMHNVAFVTCLVFALFFFVCQPWRRLGAFFLGGLMVGFSLLIRANEVVWVLPLLLGLGLAYRKQLGDYRSVLVVLLGLLLPLGTFFVVNTSVYGSAVTTGYTVEDAPLVVAQDVGSPSLWQQATQLLLPFGFHEFAILRNLAHYAYQLFPWMSILALLGMVWTLGTPLRHDKRWQIFLATFLLTGAWLAVVYGSWTFADNPDPRVISIGNSHVRYWLPMFVLTTVFAAKCLADFIRKGRVEAVLTVLLLGMCAALSWQSVSFGQDGFVTNKQALESFALKKQTIMSATEVEAIVIVDRADKYLFPQRAVVVPLRSEATYAALDELAAVAPLYYFGITLPPQDIAHLRQVRLAPLGLDIEVVASVQEETLYRLVPKP